MKFKNLLHRDDTEGERKRPLPWVADPTVSDSESEELLARRESDRSQGTENSANDDHFGKEKDKPKAFPGFRKRHEANPIELFYDLFFVANLSSFTSLHEVNNVSNLKSYIGYISLMWCVWLQTTLFNLRFHTDSVFSRIFMAFHLGIMVAFALLAPDFDMANPEESPKVFRDMSLVLMASRLVLVLQYAIVAWYVRHYRDTVVAKTAVMTILFSTAIMFLGITFVFTDHSGARGYVGWYLVSGFEAVFMIAISSFWRVLSFKNTAIVERFSAMTLMVLGEGVVGMTKSATHVAKGTTSITPASIGLMIAFVLSLYLIHMIYFDQIDKERFGTIRQQIWAILHYPLHIAILLAIEGSRSFVLYDIGRRLVSEATHSADRSLESATGPAGMVQALREVIDFISSRLVDKGKKPDFQPEYDLLLNLDPRSPNFQTLLISSTTSIIAKMDVWIMGTFGLVPYSPGETIIEIDQKLLTKANVLFAFFFVSSGVTLISLAVLHWFGKSHKTRGEILSIVVTTIIGVALALVSLIATTSDPEKLVSPYTSFMQSSWIQPVALLSFALVIGIDKLIVWVSYRRHDQRVKQGYITDLGRET